MLSGLTGREVPPKAAWPLAHALLSWGLRQGGRRAWSPVTLCTRPTLFLVLCRLSVPP